MIVYRINIEKDFQMEKGFAIEWGYTWEIWVHEYLFLSINLIQYHPCYMLCIIYYITISYVKIILIARTYLKTSMTKSTMENYFKIFLHPKVM